jgi:amidase
MPQLAWEARARAKRTSLYLAIPHEWRLSPTALSSVEGLRDVTTVPRTFLTKTEITITETKPLELLSNIHSGVWSAEVVMGAFCHRAVIAHQLVNCLTEILFEDALQQAQELDQHWQSTGALKGALHGLPVSFMDRFRIAGTETGAGYIGWLGAKETSASESLLVKQMRGLGAIPFCKTNMPMSMMLASTSNNIYGSTKNPYVRSLSSGGAAGGMTDVL